MILQCTADDDISCLKLMIILKVEVIGNYIHPSVIVLLLLAIQIN